MKKLKVGEWYWLLGENYSMKYIIKLNAIKSKLRFDISYTFKTKENGYSKMKFLHDFKIDLEDFKGLKKLTKKQVEKLEKEMMLQELAK